MKITVNQLRQIIKEEVGKMATPVTYQVVLNKLRKHGAEDNMEELYEELGVSSPDELEFGEARTPYGKKLMCGLAGTGVLTHFWDPDDRWGKMPMQYSLAGL